MEAVAGMAESEFKGASPNAHFLIGEMPAPQQLKRSWWEGTGLSIVVHALVLGVLIYAAVHAREVVTTVKNVTSTTIPILFKDQPGPGGGGGGRKDPEPPKQKAEIKAAKPVDTVTPIPKPVDIPTPQVVVPIQTPQAVETVPGALASVDLPPGTGSGSNGRGTGIGNGTGNGVGDGTGGGFGGGGFRTGGGF